MGERLLIFEGRPFFLEDHLEDHLRVAIEEHISETFFHEMFQKFRSCHPIEKHF